ncbi:type II toxin-antitoxin system HicA family toxin [Chlorogloeopsis sp. ULAP02]|uniref:type II toxin-antitoxin system HicA family toxin n=1 Tax=Chlorogloeopsis sp. ULAP02 TaxID=3107926 RepID=UPI003136ECE0
MSKLNKLVKQLLANPPEVRFEDLQYVLEAFGFEEKRSKGSHHTFEDSEVRVLTIPKKGGKKVKKVYIKRVVNLLNLEQWLQNILEGEENIENE